MPACSLKFLERENPKKQKKLSVCIRRWKKSWYFCSPFNSIVCLLSWAWMHARDHVTLYITRPFFVVPLALLFFRRCLLSIYPGNQATASSSLTSSFISCSHQSLQNKQSWLIAICFLLSPNNNYFAQSSLETRPETRAVSIFDSWKGIRNLK